MIDGPPSERPTTGEPPAPLDLGARPGAKSVPVLITPDMFAYEEDRRVDFERGMRHAPPLTILLIVGLTAIFAWQVWTMATLGPRAPIDQFALVRERVLQGEWWRMVTAAFLHGGPDHLIGNLISLYILGIACEHAVGARGMAVAFIVSALGGAVVSMALSPGPSLGASGAIFGLMSAVVLILHRNRDKLFVRDKRIGVVIAAWAAYTFVLGAISPMVDNGAHLGGLIAGALVAPLLPMRVLERASHS